MCVKIISNIIHIYLYNYAKNDLFIYLFCNEGEMLIITAATLKCRRLWISRTREFKKKKTVDGIVHLRID